VIEQQSAFATVETKQASPFLKWAGGKARLLEQFEQLMPSRFAGYHEPFVGGGAMYFHLRPQRASLSDLNDRLITTYRAIRDDVGGVMERLADHRKNHGATHFYECRKRFNARRELSDSDAAALFVYLNKTCFNGLYRENSRGEFNVPLGSYAQPTILDIEGLAAASRALQNSELRVAGFESVLDRARPGDLVYFDPPYVPVSRTSSFTSYTGAGFDSTLQVRLAQVFAELARRGVFVMLSNSDSRLVNELYAGWRIDRVRAPRSINSRATGRGAVSEVVVRSW
jgi:DNA adenine methylase